MESSAKLFELLRIVLLQLPSLLTIVGCVIAAVIRWRRHPKVSLTVIIGLTLLFAHAFVFSFVYAFMWDWFVNPRDSRALETLSTIFSFFYNSSLAILLAVLLAAVFMQRKALPGQAETVGVRS